MDKQSLIKELFKEDIEGLSTVLYKSETLTASKRWIELSKRVESNPLTLYSIIDCSNDSACVLLTNLSRILTSLEDTVANYINDEQFQKKIDSIDIESSEVENILATIFDSAAIHNSESLIKELDSVVITTELSTSPLDLSKCNQLLEWGDLLSLSEEKQNEVEERLSLGTLTEDTLEGFELDEEGFDLLDVLKSTLPFVPLDIESGQEKGQENTELSDEKELQ